MNIGSENSFDTLHPKEDFLRLREYGKVITNISELVELLETINVQTELEDDFTFEIVEGDQVAVPECVTGKIGAVEQITVSLKLGQEQIDELTTAAEARMSIMLFSRQAAFVISRSSNQDETSFEDTILWQTGVAHDFKEEDVAAVSQSEINALILSLVDPTIATPKNESDVPNYLQPAAFEVLQDIFRSISLEQKTALAYAFQKENSVFSFKKEIDDVFGEEKTLFEINFSTGSGEIKKEIVARNSMDTEFNLQFYTVGNDPDHDASSAFPAVQIHIPHTATYDDLKTLNRLIVDEMASMQDAPFSKEHVALDTLEESAAEQLDHDSLLDSDMEIADSYFNADFEQHIEGFEDKPGFDPRNFED